MTQWFWACFAAGLVVVLGTGISIVGTLVVPRRVGARVSKVVAKLTVLTFRGIARTRRSYITRDRILSFQAPTFLVALLGAWVLLFLGGFALMAVPFVPDHSFVSGLNFAGSAFFTLGFDSHSNAAPVLTVAAAFTGLVVIALQIAYLPVIYGSFNRRETLVTMLDSRAGVPAWGPEILARAEMVDNVDNLGPLYARWEEWIADVAETHTTYPVLIWLRSPHPMRSWITSLLAILDAASMDLATRPLSASPSARVMIRMGYVTLKEIASSLGISVVDDPKPDDPIQLTRDEFDAALHSLAHAGWPMERDADEAWVHFHGWRVNYEAAAYALADLVDAPPSLWSGGRHHLPQDMQAPERPPHREPSPKLQQETRRRREARGATRVGAPLPEDAFHDALHNAESDPPPANV